MTQSNAVECNRRRDGSQSPKLLELAPGLHPEHRALVQSDAAERCFEGKGLGQSDPAHRHAVGRAEHDDAADGGVGNRV